MEEKIKTIQNDNTLQDIMTKMCKVYTKHLDAYMHDIDVVLTNSKVTEIPTITIEEWILNITNILYFTVSGLEEVGLKEDVCKRIRQELYAKAHTESTGTVAERQNIALVAVQDEDLILQVYSRAYKSIKAKVDAGYEMLNSMKKILSARITDMEISNNRFDGKERE